MEETITNEELVALLEASAIETLAEFNAIYGTNYTLDEDTQNYLLAFAIVSLFGYKVLFGRRDIPQDTRERVLKKFPKDYEGIQATTRRQLDELASRLGREATQKELEEFQRERIKEITDGAYYSTRNELEALLAEREGLNVVAGITRQDDRVRDKHRQHNQKYWRASSYQPWGDYGCRCTYIYFKNRDEARQAGFTQL